jgi:hypothetical protein
MQYLPLLASKPVSGLLSSGCDMCLFFELALGGAALSFQAWHYVASGQRRQTSFDRIFRSRVDRLTSKEVGEDDHREKLRAGLSIIVLLTISRYRPPSNLSGLSRLVQL